MTPQEIIQCCERQLMLGSPNVGFLLPGKWGKRNTRRLWPGGPEGEIVSEIPGRGIYVMFDAKEVMEATKRKMSEMNDIFQVDYLPDEKKIKINLPEEVWKNIDTVIMTRLFQEELVVEKQKEIEVEEG